MHEIGRGNFFSKLRQFQIYDVEESHIGKVGDLLLRKEDLSVFAIVSHDSAIKERLEAMHIVDDRDEIVPLHRIDKGRQEPGIIYTTIAKHKLDATHSGWEVPSDYYLFSHLSKIPVIDRDGDEIGYITDIIYHEGEGYSIVVDPASYVQHFMETLHLRHRHELVIPDNFIRSYNKESFKLTLDRQEIDEMDALPIHMILAKKSVNYNKKSATAKKRYQYLVLETELSGLIRCLQEKGDKLDQARSMMEVVSFDSSDEDMVEQFVNLFNEVALTSVDPYEAMTRDNVCTHFAEGSYLAYYLNNPIGYCITTLQEDGKLGAISGIGIHHKQRGKRYSTALLAEVADKFVDQGVERVQCDVLVNNEASLGLFHGLGFAKIDDFYLS